MYISLSITLHVIHHQYLRGSTIHGQSLQNYIIETQYLPPISSLALAISGTIRWEKYENYQKRSFRNKCIVVDSNGLQTLSVPLVKGKHQQMPISKVTIAYEEPWPARHCQTIRSAYGSAPYFDYYFPDLETILTGNTSSLFSLNTQLMEKILQWIGLEDKLSVTSCYQKEPSDAVDFRNSFTPRNYHLQPCPRYLQVFADRMDFQPNLSILDLLFCTGPEARAVLNEFSDLLLKKHS